MNNTSLNSLACAMITTVLFLLIRIRFYLGRLGILIEATFGTSHRANLRSQHFRNKEDERSSMAAIGMCRHLSCMSG